MAKRIFLHLAFWIAYLYPQIYIEYAWSLKYYPNNTPFEVFLIASSGEYFLLFVRIPMVYLSFYISDKYFNSKAESGKGIAFFSLIMIFFTIMYRLIIVEYALPEIYLVSEPEAVFLPERVVRAFLDLAFLNAAANGIRLYFSRIKMKERELTLMKQKVETELSLLKSQINPHFLFNTLNNIYGLALKNSQQTAPVVLKLSQLMRFMLYEAEKKSITISDEIKLVEDYIELETLRYNDRLKISFEKDVDDATARITPLLLLPLVENAFKHGASESRQDAFIQIHISLRHDLFLFEIINSYEANKEQKREDATGIGLKNVRRQLELVYSQFQMEVIKGEEIFKVNLNIRLNSYAV